jgi:hypothetical protein
MKKIYLLIVFICSVYLSQAQSHLFVKAGAAYSNIFIVNDDNSQSRFRLGPQIGVLYTYKFPNNWNIRMELLYSDKGRKIPVAQNPNARFRLNYLNLPLLAGYQIKKFTVELGPEIGYMMSFYQRYDGVDRKITDFFDKFELAATIGITYTIVDQLLINLRYSRGLTSIVEVDIPDPSNPSSAWYNHSFQLSFALRIF